MKVLYQPGCIEVPWTNDVHKNKKTNEQRLQRLVETNFSYSNLCKKLINYNN